MSKERVKLVAKKLLENAGKHGNKKLSISQAMRDVGFSPGYAKNPQEFTNTKAWKDLMKEYLPDELIAKAHRELIEAGAISHYFFPAPKEARVGQGKKKKIVKPDELTNEEIREIVESVSGCRLIYVKRDLWGAMAFYQAPDHNSRDKGIEKAYKLRGSYAPEQIELTKRKFQHLSNAELAEMIKKARNFLLKK